MWSAVPVLGLMVLALLSLGSCRSHGLTGAATEPEGEGQIALRNDSSREAWYAYTRRCGVSVWGEDELGPRVVLHPGQSTAWTEVVGCYDLLVLTNPRAEPRYEARYRRRQVVADQATGIAIADIDWGPSTADPSLPPGPMP
ncbi:MAG TPA: hypothetical protein VFI77_07805 [Gemmatimonadales bacterium]|nr:hypothetical protein [Gemmatimonadales bacterium]